MLVRAVDGSYEPGHPGWSFGDWVRDGHPVHGWPTEDDLDYHLTTLFLEVRPRGFLELRAGEALPDRWRPALVALVSALLYDDGAREHALSELEGWAPRLDELWRRAAVDGIRDPELARAASRVWPGAVDAMARLPEGFLGEASIAAARGFLETFTERARMPADELLELQAEDPARALEWAST
jgi:glutamate--cysteine ligase